MTTLDVQVWTYLWVIGGLLLGFVNYFFWKKALVKFSKKKNKKHLMPPLGLTMVSVLIIMNPPIKHGTDQRTIKRFDREPVTIEVERIPVQQRYAAPDNKEVIDSFISR